MLNQRGKDNYGSRKLISILRGQFSPPSQTTAETLVTRQRIYALKGKATFGENGLTADEEKQESGYSPLHDRSEADVCEGVRFLREWSAATSQVADTSTKESADLLEDETVDNEAGETRLQTTALVVVGEVEDLQGREERGGEG